MRSKIFRQMQPKPQAILCVLTRILAKYAAGNTLCINEDFGKIWRKICKQDACGEILNRL